MNLKKEILESFGDDRLKDAVTRLCQFCKRNNHVFNSSNWHDVNCHIIPLTTKGEDCPYFERKDVATPLR